MTEPANSEVTETEEVDVSAFDLNIHVHRLLDGRTFLRCAFAPDGQACK